MSTKLFNVLTFDKKTKKIYHLFYRCTNWVDLAKLINLGGSYKSDFPELFEALILDDCDEKEIQEKLAYYESSEGNILQISVDSNIRIHHLREINPYAYNHKFW